MPVGGADPTNAFEMQGLTRLKATARRDERQGLREASQQFEALFLNQMLKSMRSATPQSGLFTDKATEMYTSMLDAQLSQNLSGKGLGIAEMIEKDLISRGMIDGKPDEYQETLIAGIPVARPRPLTGAIGSAVAAIPETPRNPFDEPSAYPGNRPEHVQRFVDRMAPAAKLASQASGVPAELILAQAALETGWGSKPIRTDAGADSHNLFGIKAGRHWTGKTTNISTTEYVGGNATSMVEPFRVYESADQSFMDYARLISKSSRYSSVVNANSAKEAAYQLQYSGYATDPEYGNKLVAVMDTIGPLGAGRVDQAVLNGIW